jgi:putative aldouronate transport system permease protein
VRNPQKGTPMTRAIKRDYQLWFMVIPAIVAIFIFNYIPMYGIQLAFREFDFQKGLTGGRWVGLDYFRRFVQNPMFFTTIRNTFTLSGLSILLGFPAPILMALLFNQVHSTRVKKVLQTTVYIPNFISLVVMVAMINLFLSPDTGILDKTFKAMGLLKGDANLLAQPQSFSFIYVLSGVWQGCGWSSIIYLAALSNVDPQLYDAAEIDGANRLQIIRHIDFVALMPTAVMMLILSMGGILSVGFEKVFLMQNATNYQVAEVISTYTYKVGLQGTKFSYGAAIGLFNTLVNFIFLVATNLFSRRISGYSIF